MGRPRLLWMLPAGRTAMTTCPHCGKQAIHIYACYYRRGTWCATCHHALHIARLLSGEPMIKTDIEVSAREAEAEAKLRHE